MNHLFACFGAVVAAAAGGILAQEGRGGQAKALATRNVAIVIHEGVELLDFAGPGEVFEAAADRATVDDTPWFRVYTVAPTREALVSQNFLTIVPEYSIDDAPSPDVLVIPGGATGVLLRDERFMEWVERSLPTTEVALSVCTGAFVLARLGELDGKTITTHWSALDGLRRDTQDATVLDDVRFTDNGAIVTSAGVSAGIDGSLHVVARLLGYDHARETARYMQYEWSPTDAEVASYPALNPHLNEVQRRLQQASQQRTSGNATAAIEAYRSITVDHPDCGEAWYYLGYLLHTQQHDLQAAIPAHARAGQTATGRFRTNGLYNLACAHALQGDADAAVEALTRCADSGYIDPRWVADDTDLDSVRDDPRFTAVFARMQVTGARQHMGYNNDDVALEHLRGAAANGFSKVHEWLIDPAFARLHSTPGFRALQREHSLASDITIAADDEPGTMLLVRGSIIDTSGRPVADARIYVFAADDRGHYTREQVMNEADARLYGYLRSDPQGRFSFRTVRPGGYPPRDGQNGEEWLIPQHIHVEIDHPQHRRYFQQWVFEDDPRMTAYWRQWADREERPILRTRTDEAGVEHAEIEVVLEAAERRCTPKSSSAG